MDFISAFLFSFLFTLKILFSFCSQHQILWNFAGIMIMSCMSSLWNLNVSSVLIFILCKETRYLLDFTVRHYWVTNWLLSSLVITYIKWAVKGTWAFFYINNPRLVMAKIKLIKSLRSIKRTTIRYNGLKFRLLLTGSIALKSIRQLIVVIFTLKDIFNPPPPPF